MSRVKGFCLIFLFLPFFLFSDSIYLKSEAIVFNEGVQLQDVAHMDNNVKKNCGSLLIGVSPEFKKVTVLNKKEIKERLDKNGFKGLILKGCDKVIVRRGGILVKPEFLQKMVTNYIKNNSPWRDNFNVELKSTKKIIIPEGKISWRLYPANGQDFFQNMLFRIKAYQNQNEILSDWLMIRLRVFREVALSKRTITQGELLRPSDIRWEKRELNRLHQDAVLDPSKIMGQRLSRNISANTIISKRVLMRNFSIRRGEHAFLVANYKMVSASLKVVALSNGKLGDYIKVQNPQSKKILMAKVVGKQKLEVDVQ